MVVIIDPTDLGGPGAPKPVVPAPRPAPLPAPSVGGSSRTLAYLVAFNLLFVLVLAGVFAWLYWRPVPGPGPGPGPAPVADYDAAFVPIGKALAAAMGGPDFAASYEDGTKLIEAGQTRQAAGETAARSYATRRQATFDRLAGPALEAVYPHDQSDDRMTPEQRKALVRARRGISRGASGP